jgi:hypothetical protein
MALVLFLIIVAIMLGLVDVAEGLHYLLFIGIAVLITVLPLAAARVPARRPVREPLSNRNGLPGADRVRSGSGCLRQ